MALIPANLRVSPRPPTWYGARQSKYHDYLTTSTQIAATDYFITAGYDLYPGDLIWCKLSDGYFSLQMTTSTTAAVI